MHIVSITQSFRFVKKHLILQIYYNESKVVYGVLVLVLVFLALCAQNTFSDKFTTQSPQITCGI